MDRQSGLPFGDAEAVFQDDRTLMNAALAAVQCDLHERVFVEWVFNVTDAGRKPPLKRSYPKLAATPLGLCCSVGKARTTVERCIRLGLIRYVPNYRSNGDRDSNGYTWDRDGCRSILVNRFSGRGSATTAQGSATTAQGSATTAQGSATTAQGSATTAQALTSLVSLFNNPPPPPFNSNSTNSTSNEWEGVEDEIVAAGVNVADKALKSARAHGCTPGHVRSLIEEFLRRQASAPDAWGAGALKHRIQIARPWMAVTDRWLPPNESVGVAQAAQAEQERRAVVSAAKNRDTMAYTIIRDMRAQGIVDDAVIKKELSDQGLKWP